MVWVDWADLDLGVGKFLELQMMGRGGKGRLMVVQAQGGVGL